MLAKTVDSDVVIIGGIHHNTLGVVRSLGERGIRKHNVYVCIVGAGNSHKNIISKSKYVSAANIAYLQTDLDVPEYLFNLAKDHKKRVIICCSDGSAEVIMKSFEFLREWYELPSIKKDISQLMEKQYQSELAKKVGFNIPQSSVIRKIESDQWSLFPCITKPCKSVCGGEKPIFIFQTTKASLLRH